MKLRYTEPAAIELAAVLDYLAERSPDGAARVLARIRAIERLLLLFPYSGEVTRLDWLRRVTTQPYPYVIYYEVAGDEIVVHRIRHAARNKMPDAP